MQDELQKQEQMGGFNLFESEDPLVGKVLDGRWKLIQALGDGSMSRSYKAEHLQTGEFVVVKILHKRISITTANIRRFDNASREVMSLKHQKVCKLLDIHLDSEGEIFIVMEFLPGESLENLLARTGHLPVHKAVEIFSQVCDALECGHEEGVMHRDIKPSNIMITERDHGREDIRLLDFGVSNLLADEGDDLKNSGYITRTKEVAGNPMYMSPEQCMGKRTDMPADLYSLGCVMYEALTGKPPFVGKNVLETAYKHMNEQPKPISSEMSRDKILGRLEAAIFKCLAKDPADRYQSPSHLKNDLALLSSATDADWANQSFVHKKAPRLKKKKKTQERGQTVRQAPSIEMMALFGAGVVIVIIAIVWIVCFLNSDTQEGPAYNNDELWKLKDKSKQSEQPDFAGLEDSARTELARAERENGANSKEYAKATAALAKVYMDSTHWAEAITTLKTLVKLYQDLHLSDEMPVVNAQLSYANFMLGKNQEAEEQAQEALREIDDSQTMPPEKKQMISWRPLEILGEIYATAGTKSCNLAKAEECYQKLREARESTKMFHANSLIMTSAKLGDVYRREGKWDKAENFYHEALMTYNINIKQPGPAQAKMEYGLGLVMMKENKYAQAETLFKDALSTTRNIYGEKGELYNPIKRQLSEIKWKTNFWGSLMAKLSGDTSNY
jgi:serine/threonine protein kinase